MFSGSHSRIPCNKIFYVNDFNMPLNHKAPPAALKHLMKEAHDKKSQLELIMECFRWAPSASNSQSWKVLFIERDKSFLFLTASRSGFYKYIDIGIGLLHWEMAAA